MQSEDNDTPKDSRHVRHKCDLESDNESYNSVSSEEEEFDKPLKKKQKKVSDDSVLLDEFQDYLVMQKSLSSATSKKHCNNMHKISKRRGYFNIKNLLDIPKNYDTITKHELIEPHQKTSIEYFNGFLGYKFPEISSNNQTVKPLPPSVTITFSNIPYKEGMTITLVTK